MKTHLNSLDITKRSLAASRLNNTSLLNHYDAAGDRNLQGAEQEGPELPSCSSLCEGIRPTSTPEMSQLTLRARRRCNCRNGSRPSTLTSAIS